jgi:alpha-1,6-mannosyltransferase
VVVPAAAVMALAAGVKSPAFIGLAFVVPLVLTRRGVETRTTPRLAAAVTVSALLSGLLTFVAVSAVTGFGLGWLHQVGSGARLVNWLSLPTDAAILANAITGHPDGASHLDDPMRHWRVVGLALSAVLVVAIWFGAVLLATGNRLWRRVLPVGTNRPATVVTLLGAAMLVLTLLGPAVQLWYLLWALPFLIRATEHRRTLVALVATQLAMVFTVDPHGLSFTMKPVVVVIIAVSTAVAWLALRDLVISPSPPAHDDPHRARAGVHADGRRHL